MKKKMKGKEKTHQLQANITFDCTVQLQADRCPVCNGNGLVPGGFYTQVSGQWSSSSITETCRSCGGEGYVVLKHIEGKDIKWVSQP